MNKQGLTRDIPEAIKREVRQTAGFGCVLCGVAIIEYEHVDPEYSEAKEHRAEGITILCPTCHAKKTRGFLSADAVKAGMADPVCKRQGFSFEFMEGQAARPTVYFASSRLANCVIPVMIQGIPVLQVDAPEEPGGPYLVSSYFLDGNGQPSLVMQRNEWRVNSGQWDVQVAGGRVSIHSAPRVPALVLHFLPGHGVTVEALDMMVGGVRYLGDSEKLEVWVGKERRLTLQDNSVSGARVGFNI